MMNTQKYVSCKTRKIICYFLLMSFIFTTFTYQIFAVNTTNAKKDIQRIDSSSIEDKVIAGYQGWFSCDGDGSPTNEWMHWSKDGDIPEVGNITVEMYPDIEEYPLSSLYQTGFDDLGNGQPAKLFTSYSEDVVQKHFEWMRDYGIEGVAVQRFVSVLGSNYGDQFSGILDYIKKAAQHYNRIFYVQYDISGANPNSFIQTIKDDWTNVVNDQLNVTSSNRYAKQDGKLVVCLWGIGFTHNPGTADEILELINWFKDQGCYVIGGVPTNWRTSSVDSKAGFEEVYKELDMISPWTVGRIPNAEGTNAYKTSYLIPDNEYCIVNGMAYQPVIYPGFAWSNWVGGAKNLISREQGNLFWKQAYNVADVGVGCAYIAMFDEYDEGTAIMKAASDSSMIPKDQYFLTLSTEGTYLSSDYYLRLAGSATRMIKGIDSKVAEIPIRNSEGPIYTRTSFEKGLDALPDFMLKEATVQKELTATLDSCDELTGWETWNVPLSINTEDKKEGLGSIEAFGNGAVWFAKKFATTVDTGVTESEGRFKLWLYVSDVSKLTIGGQIELTSSGGPDVDEYSWDMSSLGLVNGWNELSLDFNKAAKLGNPNINALNFIRIYYFLTDSIKVKADDMHFEKVTILPHNATSVAIQNVIGAEELSQPTCQVVDDAENSHLLKNSLKIAGVDTEENPSFVEYDLFDVDIPVNSSTTLSFWKYCEDELSKYVLIDLYMTDGSTLKEFNVTTTNGENMSQNSAIGTIGEWEQVNCEIGKWLNKKTIDKIKVYYYRDGDGDVGEFTAYIDDIVVEDKK